jgi:hypothetical protein
MSEAYDASDPRDKIYGLLGHPTAHRADGTLLVKPQYGWTLREVYIDFARKWLDNEKDATILSYAVFTEKFPMLQTVAVFPSWCPQWHVRCGLYASLGVRTATVDYNTSGNSKVDHQWLARDQLEIKGFTFGTISEAFEVFPKGHVSYQKRDASTCGIRTFSSIIYAIMKRLRLLSLVHGSTTEALAMTISASHAIGNYCFTSDDNTAAGRRLQHEAFCNFLIQQAELDSGFNLDDFPGTRASASAEGKAVMPYYQRCAERYPMEKRVCVVDGMDGKYLCLGPGFARENDVICILFGAMTPFVLRPVSNGMYLLIGDCYVHDIMYGEAMEAFRSSANGKESFIII